MVVPFFLFIALPVLGVVVLLWCYLCYKIGSWLVEGLFPRRRRPVYADLPVREHYQSPVPPAPPRPTRSCRRGGGGGAFLMLLVVVAVVLGFRSFTHQRRSHDQARFEQARTQLETKRAKINRSKTPKRSAETVAMTDHREGVWVADAAEEVFKAPELPTEQQNSGWVLGLGKSREDAWQSAQDKAYDTALAYLTKHLPGVQWTPPRAYVEKKLVKEFRDMPDQKLDKAIDGIEVARQVSVRVEVTPGDVQDILKHDREDRVEQRMTLLAKLLGLVVLLFSAVAAYIRIDEYSKGYLTGWLRVAGIVTAAAAGLFMFMR
jgi:hypothetical protein